MSRVAGYVSFTQPTVNEDRDSDGPPGLYSRS